MSNKVITITGPGAANEELEKLLPSQHFELTAEELMEAIKDPEATAKRLGLEPGVKAIHVSYPEDYQAVDARTMYCCIRCLSDSWCCTAWPQ